MPQDGLTLALVLIGTSMGSALVATVALYLLLGRGRPAESGLFDAAEDDTVFLFDGERLVDATAPARALLAASTVEGTPWAQLVAYLAPQFPDIGARLAALKDSGPLTCNGKGADRLDLLAEWRDGLVRVTLLDAEADGQVVTLDAMSYRATTEELVTLRATMEHAPILAWREDGEGSVIWANRAYLVQATRRGEALRWPLPVLFAPERRRTGSAQRLQLTNPGGEKQGWYDCHCIALDQDRLFFAMPADATVQAESAHRSFMQTLGKTFAHLPVGLAIFDRQRRLQLFNPALTDLTSLGAEFLSARPTLAAFLDQLRDRQMLPEPRDYKSWRQQFTEMEHGTPGNYEETWMLPSGQTYRVSGRPHADGAVAFLVEDISAEITLTRRFRAELETGQAVLDALEEAIVVFSPAGVVTMSNRAYARLWNSDPAATLGEVGLPAVLRQWQDACRPDPVWAELPRRISARADWSGSVTMCDGRALTCRLAPLVGGGLMIGFRPATAPGLRDLGLVGASA